MTTSKTPEELRQAQLRFYKQQVDLVDFDTIPRELREVVDKTLVSNSTMREVVRYAHERLNTAYREVQDAENQLARRNISEKDRGYGRRAEANTQRAAHRDDEDWIGKARMSDLLREARLAACERRAMESSASNLRQVIENHDRVEALKSAGKVSVWNGPTEYSDGSPRGPRNGGGRGGGNRGNSNYRGASTPTNRGRSDGQRTATDSDWWRSR